MKRCNLLKCRFNLHRLWVAMLSFAVLLVVSADLNSGYNNRRDIGEGRAIRTPYSERWESPSILQVELRDTDELDVKADGEPEREGVFSGIISGIRNGFRNFRNFIARGINTLRQRRNVNSMLNAAGDADESSETRIEAIDSLGNILADSPGVTGRMQENVADSLLEIAADPGTDTEVRLAAYRALKGIAGSDSVGVALSERIAGEIEGVILVWPVGDPSIDFGTAEQGQVTGFDDNWISVCSNGRHLTVEAPDTVELTNADGETLTVNLRTPHTLGPVYERDGEYWFQVYVGGSASAAEDQVLGLYDGEVTLTITDSEGNTHEVAVNVEVTVEEWTPAYNFGTVNLDAGTVSQGESLEMEPREGRTGGFRLETFIDSDASNMSGTVELVNENGETMEAEVDFHIVRIDRPWPGLRIYSGYYYVNADVMEDQAPGTYEGSIVLTAVDDNGNISEREVEVVIVVEEEKAAWKAVQ